MKVNLVPVVEELATLSATLRRAADDVDRASENMAYTETIEYVNDVISLVANLLPALRMDVLIGRSIRELIRVIVLTEAAAKIDCESRESYIASLKREVNSLLPTPKYKDEV
jgi:hypothetical protein